MAGRGGLRYDPATMRRLLLRLVPFTLLLALVLAPAAQADNNGRGFYGAINDKLVTEVGLILVVFFPVFIFVMSMLQRHLEKRKEARMAARKAHAGNAQWRGGW
jgi:hypothetical protein